VPGLADLAMTIMRRTGVEVELIRAVDQEIATGVWPDMTEHGWPRDDWPAIFEKVIAADILVLLTPIWLGEKSSVCTQVIERLYGNSHLLNEHGQYAYYGRVGGCLVTGNEDGVKHCAMNVLYSLQHLGYAIPPQADAGWIGEAGPGPSYLDGPPVPDQAARLRCSRASSNGSRESKPVIVNARWTAGGPAMMPKPKPSSADRSCTATARCNPLESMNVVRRRSSTTRPKPSPTSVSMRLRTSSTVLTSSSPTGQTRTPSRSGSHSTLNGSGSTPARFRGVLAAVSDTVGRGGRTAPPAHATRQSPTR
jgi:multimeric flavodoxin WrbA